MLSWLAPLGATCCFLVYATGIFPPGMNDLIVTDTRVVADARSIGSRVRPLGVGPHLVITVVSSRNLVAMAHNSQLNTYPIVADCADRDLTFDSSGPYHGGLHTAGSMDDRLNPRFATLRTEKADRFDYQIFVPMTGRLRSGADFNRPMYAYDLGREHRTLCVRLGGGNMMGGFFRSNELRVAVPPQ
jgi:hypothetical protein